MATRPDSVFSQRDPLYICREGYPTDAGPGFKDANFSDLVISYRVISDGRVDETYVYAEKRRSLRLEFFV